jgi:nucleoside-diphosphate-sugar epimerase
MKNAEGTYIWAEQAESSNVRLQIFISSLSADEGAIAPYGQKKYEVEKWFIKHNHFILRPGVVIGKGGLFGRITATVKKSPVIPLIDSGKTMMYLTDVDTLSDIIRDTILDKNKVQRGRIWCVQQEMPHAFLDILKEIRRQNNLFRIFIPVPYFVVSVLLNLLEKIRFLQFGINMNNLQGLRQLRDKKFKSDLKYLGYKEYSLATLIHKTSN